jgi:hypothetical protein
MKHAQSQAHHQTEKWQIGLCVSSIFSSLLFVPHIPCSFLLLLYPPTPRPFSQVQTIGDAYVACTGLPFMRPGSAAENAKNCVRMGLAMLREISGVRTVEGGRIRMRIGIHVGTIGARPSVLQCFLRSLFLTPGLQSTRSCGFASTRSGASVHLGICRAEWSTLVFAVFPFI